MLRLAPKKNVVVSSCRLFSTSLRLANAATPVKTDTESKEARVAEILSKQAPNRTETWAKSQKPRAEALSGVRIIQRDIEMQPRPYAGIELIAKEPIKYLDDHTNIAVCDGGRGVQGHPKIFINLDKPGAHPCQYCGNRYALEKYKEGIEAGEYPANVKT